MSTSTTEIANPATICKKGHVRCPMATSKPFVVCSVATKRYAPSTKGISRDGSLPAVVPNAGPRRPQPSRFAPSQPFVVCSLSTKRHAPSKRASTSKVSQHGSTSPPLPMPTPRTETANPATICKKGHVRCPMGTSKPFVVCSVATKRYAPSTKGISREGSLPAVVPNAGPRRPQPSRFAPSKPFVVCSLSTKRHAPSKRASTNKVSQHGSTSPPLPMPTPRTETANLATICKKGHVPCPMATPKPFVVCSVATKRYAPSTKGVSRDGSLPAVVPNAGPRRPQPSRFAPSKPFVVCSLSTKRYAPSKRASTNTPITYHDAMSSSSSPDLSSFLSQSCRVVPSLNRCSY
ncbi:hypothetical protein L210DRAFT_3547537 [Boletus edulis BED1]|uniref:Uncharacterized protein n=1 Tax=Boletus edulis BED1 TaxID=1328754 RepID=A0AAD4GDE2_BOLED|nr:hypothetical protein L210DRAFT_3547537 [Boletus edulis BED1]